MKSHLFGHMPDATGVQAFSLRSGAELTATIAQYGPRITELLAPLPDGGRDVTLGFDRQEPYLSESGRLTLHRPDGDQGFPGALDATVEYRPPRTLANAVSRRRRWSEGRRLQRARRQPPLMTEHEAWRSSRLLAAM
jgi:hypothetical protein